MVNFTAVEGKGAAASAGQLYPDDRSWHTAAAVSGQLDRDNSAGRTDPHPGPLETSQHMPGATEETAHHTVKGKQKKKLQNGAILKI